MVWTHIYLEGRGAPYLEVFGLLWWLGTVQSPLPVFVVLPVLRWRLFLTLPLQKYCLAPVFSFCFAYFYLSFLPFVRFLSFFGLFPLSHSVRAPCLPFLRFFPLFGSFF